MPAVHLTVPVLSAKQIARFHRKVAKGASDECWPYTGAVYVRNGLPQHAYFWYRPARNAKTIGVGAHVIARWLATGEWPTGLLTCHTCDNPPCCNPAHLYLGTARDNSRDTVVRKRARSNAPKGEASGRAKLTEANVAEIRRLHTAGLATQSDLGRRFGVTNVAIRHIVTRRTWKHLP